VLGTIAVLVAVPQREVSELQGVMQAIARTGERAHLPTVTVVIAVLITVGSLGSVGAWLASTARLPFVVGLDRRLPPAFARLHPRWGTPYVGLLVQAAGAAFIIVLGQAGASVRGAYDALISLAIIAQFIPYLFMFAAMIVLQREPAGPEVVRTPGGAPVAKALGALGFVVSVATIVLACVPAADDPNRALAVIKIVGGSVVLIATGAVIYYLGTRRK